MGLLDKLYNPSKKVINSLERVVSRINSLEESVKQLSDKDLQAKTLEFKKRFNDQGGDKNLETSLLEDILPEAFAVMREAMRRVWGERHFDVQIIGGLVLHQGKIAEMKTGEGKTIVAALPLYLNALAGRGVHFVTVNDYLSKHQGEGMGEVYNFLGLSTGIIQSNQETYRFKKHHTYKHYSECEGLNLEPCSRKEAYACDITYGTNNEFGFDYLRDNMAPTLEFCSQRELNYAIVDEVDSILIDEARTPLIISAPAEESAGMYQRFAALVPKLKSLSDYVIDEKDKVVTLTDEGIKKVEELLNVDNIYEAGGISLVHHLEQSLKAEALFKKDRDYVVRDGEIIIVDEFTGRLMVGRRYSEGLHQAIEAKEGVEVKKESQTLATISFQNLFRMYGKLAGMTGTAATEAEEFFKIYKLDVVEIPTNKAVVRQDLSDKIYKTESAKIEAIVEDVRDRNKKGQPVLIGTVSVSKNELLSRALKKAGIKHQVLNAKHHQKEAKIIAKAGLIGAVTVATNMAGRGTDIKISAEVKSLGGLHVLGTERHEARRIDNQLRGRSGRQGDPGSSQFFVSMEDDLMRVFGGDRMKSLMTSLGLPDDMPIENKLISRSIESSQRRVEGYNFDARKHLVEYDDVMNKHREVIYRKRRKALEMEIVEDNCFLRDEICEAVSLEVSSIQNQYYEDEEKIYLELKAIFGDVKFPSLDKLHEFIFDFYDQKEKTLGALTMRQLERAVYLRVIDMLWVEHLTTMDELRTGIGLRGYGQRDPLIEYKQEAFHLFESLLRNIETTVSRMIFKAEIEAQKTEPITRKPLEYTQPDQSVIGGFEDDKDNLALEQKLEAKERQQRIDNVTVKTISKGRSVYDRMKEASVSGSASQVKKADKIGRNDPCSCGSGKKYKKCCGK